MPYGVIPLMMELVISVGAFDKGSAKTLKVVRIGIH